MKKRFATIPNVISLIRMFLGPVVFMLLMNGERVTAFIVYSIAALSDALDGWVAKRFNQKTDIGSLLDALADRVFIVIVVLALISLDNLSWFVYFGIGIWVLEEIILGGLLTLKNKRIYLRDIHRNSIRAAAFFVFATLGVMVLQLPIIWVHVLMGISVVLIFYSFYDYYINS